MRHATRYVSVSYQSRQHNNDEISRVDYYFVRHLSSNEIVNSMYDLSVICYLIVRVVVIVSKQNTSICHL